ncbi:MAG: GntR family transcriptional regulator [Anaerolineae bacterium]|nr:GntR family transcriptional regulator [Anaerolineae bacterium]
MPLQFEPLRNRALRDAIAAAIRGAIAAGQLRPGDAVPEALIAEQMGVSRSPVREAFRKLEEQGMLVSYPHRGTYVATFTEKDAEDIYQLRAGLEGLAVRWALEQGEGAPLVDRLQGIVERMRPLVGTDRFVDMADLDSEFHSAIMEASGNTRLMQVWRGMDPFVWMMVSAARRSEDEVVPQRLIPEHEELVEAIASLDPRRAEEAAHAHIVRRRAFTLATLRQGLDGVGVPVASGSAEDGRV